MDQETYSLVVENFTMGLVFVAIAFIFIWVAYLQNYFSLPYRHESGARVRLRHVISTFLIFLVLYIILAPFVMRLFFRSTYILTHAETALAILQLIVFVLAVGFFWLYCAFQERQAMRDVWKMPSFSGNQPIGKDIQYGLVSWLVSLPSVIAIGQLSLVIALLIFGPTEQEQAAVRYMKEALESPFALGVALFSILIAAPLIEEFLFRGILMSYLRTKMSSISAIVVSAILFAFFHYAPSQSSTNIPLICSLFTFACFLGLAYEKTRSLWTSIVLHVTFNAASVIRIIFTTF